MIYNSAEIIPAKLFFKILATEDYTLLSDKKYSQKELLEAWNIIKEEHDKLNPDNNSDKVLNLSKRIESLVSKYESIRLSIYHLRVLEDDELLSVLKNYDYKFTGNLQEDLDVAERHSNALIDKIKELEERMPKVNKKGKDDLNFDEAVMSYSSFIGSGFIDPNTIKLSQYYALINIGNKKIKSLEKGNN
jgi:hypothetical protein